MIDFKKRSIVKGGLLTGVVLVYLSLVGMVEGFDKRELIAGWMTLGQLILFAPIFWGGYFLAHQHRELRWVTRLVSAGLLGIVAALPVLLLVFVIQTANTREMFVNATPQLTEILLLGRKTISGGAPLLLLTFAILATLGGSLSLLEDKWRKAISNALIWTVGLAALSQLVKQITLQLLGKGSVQALFKGDIIRPTFAMVIFLLIFSLSLWWAYRGETIQNQLNALPAQKRRTLNWVGYGLLMLLLLVLPLILGRFLSEVLVIVGLYVIMGLGLNIAVGLAGLLDLGYVTNFAIGAYIMGIFTSTSSLGLVQRAGLPQLGFWLVVPICIVAAMITGFTLAMPVLKMRGDYLAIATLGFGEIIRLLALSDWLKPYIGGAQGILGVPKATFFGLPLVNPEQIYYLVLGAALFILFISYRLNNSRTGRQWMALREDEDVAAAMGINTTLTKVIAFTISAASGGLAGAIFAVKLGTLFPNSFGLLVSINVLALIIVGGMGSIPGIIVGAIALVGLPEILREFSEFRLLVYGIVLMVMMLTRPEGLWPSAIVQRELAGSEAQSAE